MDDLLADFIAETREMTEALSGELVAWEAAPDDRERLDAIFRFVHTVKGNCGFFDFPRLEKLSHAAEDALGEVRSGKRVADEALVSAVLAIIDRIGELTDAIEAGEALPDGGDEQLVAALDGTGESFVPAVHNPSDSAPSQRAASAAVRSIRLPVDLLDRMMSGVSDLMLARNHLAQRLRDTDPDPRLMGSFERMSAMLEEVRDAATRMRMHRIDTIFSAFPRMVRDLAKELGKQVLIDLEGGEVELDREMLESVRDPLTHIIRNAIDHGIETPAERRAAGKHETGTLSIGARQAGNEIYILIRDDGRGIDADRVVAKAIENGVIDAEEAATMPTHAKLALIFAPGLSTKDEVSAISGRGVGMDVVRENIERIGGTIEVSSKPGQGALFYLRLPLTLSIVATLSIEVANQIYALPRSYVDEVLAGGPHQHGAARIGDRDTITFRGERIASLALRDVLDLPPTDTPDDQLAIILNLASGDRVALFIDRVHNQEDAVIQPVSPQLSRLGLYTGVTLLDDGTPVLMLDLASICWRRKLVSSVSTKRSAVTEDRAPAARVEAERVMIFVGLDGERRAIAMAALDYIDTVAVDEVEHHNGTARAVLDGAIRTLEGVDGHDIGTERLRVLRIKRGDTLIYHAIRAIIDVVEPDAKIAHAAATDAATERYVSIDGRPVPLLDRHAIGSHHKEPAR